MRPTFSIIFFTTSSGAGYGLLALLALLVPLGLLPADRWLGGVALALGLALVTAGLLSSTFHLGHPERAWRALTQWRSSWLSREGVAALLAYPPLLAFGFGWVALGEAGGLWGALGMLGALVAALTVYSTGMIYASLRAVPEWHNPLVTPGYLVLAVASGGVWLNAVAHLFGVSSTLLSAIAGLALAVAWGLKQHYWRTIREPQPVATAGTATGLGRLGRVRLLEKPHTGGNYLLHEMGFEIGRKHADRLRWLAQAFGFALPLVATVVLIWLPPVGAGILAVLAALSMSLGLVAERWLFFAEARHAVQLYYGREAV